MQQGSRQETKDRSQARRRAYAAAAVIATLAVAATSLRVFSDGEQRVALRLVVDDTVQPSTAQVEGLEDGDEPRPAGRMVAADGTASDFVLDELNVAVHSEDELQAFLGRWDGTVLDRFDGSVDPGEPRDVLVRVDPSAADVARAAAHLHEVEPDLAGTVRVDRPEALALLAIAAEETAIHGTEVSPNWLDHLDGIADSKAIEGDAPIGPNAVTWSYMRNGGAQNTAVPAAWRLLYEHRKHTHPVRIMIADGGFNPSPDFPEWRKIRQAKWVDSNRMDCGDNECPYHGTQVAVTAAGLVDNEIGTAGTAPPVVQLVATGVYADRWKNYRRIEQMVDEERPDIVNMSFSSSISAFKGASEKAADRRFKRMVNMGALLVAAAGNDGKDVDASTCIGSRCSESRLIIPCESKHVLCVGGMGTGTTAKAGGSNFGRRSGQRTVEIYGPFCVIGPTKPETSSSGAVGWICGTSFASPFVAGVAALVKAADPSLSPTEIRQILLDTAHEGGVMLPLVAEDGSQKRINALGAVAKALGVEITPPALKILRPKQGSTHGIETWLDFEAEATDYAGTSLPVAWHSDKDGAISKASSISVSSPLSVGTHVITATATDDLGVEASATVSVTVQDTPPTATIIKPVEGAQPYEGASLDLIGATFDPDTYGAVPDDAAAWTIVRSATKQTVWSGEGHAATVPGNVLQPGAYEVRFSASDGGGSSTETRSILVKQLPPGETLPVPTILDPDEDQTFFHGTTVTLRGSATDAEDGSLSGTRFKWTITSDSQKETVVCVGSGLGGGGGDQFAAYKDCTQTEVTLEVEPGSMTTTYSITLEVWDSSGLPAETSVSVIVEHPPVP